MSEIRYYRANKETSAKIAAELQAWQDSLKQARAIAKRLGARRDVYTGIGMLGMTVRGFAFGDESQIDRKQFVRLKGTSDGWRPRAGTAIAKELEALGRRIFQHIACLVGMDQMSAGRNGMMWHRPGVTMVDGIAYLSLTASAKGTGCKRISDVEYDRVTANKPRRKRKAANP